MRKLIHFCYMDDSGDHFAVAPEGMSTEEAARIANDAVEKVLGSPDAVSDDWTEKMRKRKLRELVRIMKEAGFELVEPYRVYGL